MMIHLLSSCYRHLVYDCDDDGSDDDDDDVEASMVSDLYYVHYHHHFDVYDLLYYYHFDEIYLYLDVNDRLCFYYHFYGNDLASMVSDLYYDHYHHPFEMYDLLYYLYHFDEIYLYLDEIYLYLDVNDRLRYDCQFYENYFSIYRACDDNVDDDDNDDDEHDVNVACPFQKTKVDILLVVYVLICLIFPVMDIVALVPLVCWTGQLMMDDHGVDLGFWVCAISWTMTDDDVVWVSLVSVISWMMMDDRVVLASSVCVTV
jgi:hypothetical protein